MPFDNAAARDYADMVGYERFVLARALRTLEEFQGIQDPHHVELNSRLGATINIGFTETIGIGSAVSVLEFMRPLLFTAAFKVLDQSVEWMLKINLDAGVIDKVPWRFVEKRALIRSATNLQRPPLCATFPLVWSVLIGAFDHLTEFRNTIIHDHSFTLAPGVMRISPKARPPAAPRELVVTDQELYALVRLAQALCDGLSRTTADHRDLVLAAAADCVGLHGQVFTRPPVPVLVRVTWTEPAQFPLDIEAIRSTLKRIFPEAGGLRFDLSLHALICGQRYDWTIPSDALAGHGHVTIAPPDEWDAYLN